MVICCCSNQLSWHSFDVVHGSPGVSGIPGPCKLKERLLMKRSYDWYCSLVFSLFFLPSMVDFVGWLFEEWSIREWGETESVKNRLTGSRNKLTHSTASIPHCQFFHHIILCESREERCCFLLDRDMVGVNSVWNRDLPIKKILVPCFGPWLGDEASYSNISWHWPLV